MLCDHSKEVVLVRSGVDCTITTILHIKLCDHSKEVVLVRSGVDCTITTLLAHKAV